MGSYILIHLFVLLGLCKALQLPRTLATLNKISLTQTHSQLLTRIWRVHISSRPHKKCKTRSNAILFFFPNIHNSPTHKHSLFCPVGFENESVRSQWTETTTTFADALAVKCSKSNFDKGLVILVPYNRHGLSVVGMIVSDKRHYDFEVQSLNAIEQNSNMASKACSTPFANLKVNPSASECLVRGRHHLYSLRLFQELTQHIEKTTFIHLFQ